METIKKNLSASVYDKLKNVARQRRRPVEEVLKYYVMERFLYRLGEDKWKNFLFEISEEDISLEKIVKDLRSHFEILMTKQDEKDTRPTLK